MDGRYAGGLALADPLREESPRLVQALKDRGMRVVLLSGDNTRTARAVAARAGVEEVIADVLPDGKDAVIADMQAKGLHVGMVGDGINDAPALARAMWVWPWDRVLMWPWRRATWFCCAACRESLPRWI